jgi:hypothetical protein
VLSVGDICEPDYYDPVLFFVLSGAPIISIACAYAARHALDSFSEKRHSSLLQRAGQNIGVDFESTMFNVSGFCVDAKTCHLGLLMIQVFPELRPNARLLCRLQA